MSAAAPIRTAAVRSAQGPSLLARVGVHPPAAHLRSPGALQAHFEGESSRREAAQLHQAIAIYRVDEEAKSALRPLFQFSKVSMLKSNTQKTREIEARGK